jgi:uncharacterized transporter YbjL
MSRIYKTILKALVATAACFVYVLIACIGLNEFSEALGSGINRLGVAAFLTYFAVIVVGLFATMNWAFYES